MYSYGEEEEEEEARWVGVKGMECRYENVLVHSYTYEKCVHYSWLRVLFQSPLLGDKFDTV